MDSHGAKKLQKQQHDYCHMSSKAGGPKELDAIHADEFYGASAVDGGEGRDAEPQVAPIF
jgi:hypothetical protein